MYRVFTLEFKTFEEVVQWAWDTYKIDANFVDHLSMHEDLKQQACEQLEEMISEFPVEER